MKIIAEPELFTITPATGSEDDYLIVSDGHIIGTGKTEGDALDEAIAKVTALEQELRDYKNYTMGFITRGDLKTFVTREEV